jgi:hypothetical protein
MMQRADNIDDEWYRLNWKLDEIKRNHEWIRLAMFSPDPRVWLRVWYLVLVLKESYVEVMSECVL